MMFYYKDNDQLYTSTISLPDLQEITEQEYNTILDSLKPTEEEIKAQKEAQMLQLMHELYPDKEE